MFENFDFEILNDPDFKEDAVREEIILPIIKALGYKISGDNRIIRSKSLIHPYVAIGSKQRKISIVPDYVFLSDGSPYWIMDAKAPKEDLLHSKHIEQAYSYAIHPEIRAELFALCNGKKFILFSIKKWDPLLHFEIQNIGSHWDQLFRMLNPEIKANPELLEYHPDYGLFLYRLGVEKGFKLISLAVNSNFIAKVEDGLYTISTLIPGDVDYALSLDCNEKQFQQLLSLLPDRQSKIIEQSLKRQPYVVHLKNEDFQFGCVSVLKDEMCHNQEETYIPFEVEEFMEYMWDEKTS